MPCEACLHANTMHKCPKLISPSGLWPRTKFVLLVVQLGGLNSQRNPFAITPDLLVGYLLGTLGADADA